jgi:hypothetical protein
MRVNSKSTIKIVEAIIIIKKIGKAAMEVIRNSKMIKLSINLIMKIINQI